MAGIGDAMILLDVLPNGGRHHKFSLPAELAETAPSTIFISGR